MTRRPAAAWYILPAVIVMAAMGFAAFGFGVQVRELIDEVESINPTTTVALDAGDTRVIYKRVERPFTSFRSSCEVVPAVSALDPVDSDADFSIGDDRWVGVFIFEAPIPGRYTFTCTGGSWGLGPGFGVDGGTTATTLAEWSGLFALRFVPGLLLGGVVAGVIAWTRRSAT